MKVAFVYPHTRLATPAPQLFDALAIVTYELTRRLARQHDVVVYPRRGPGEAPEDVLENVVLRRIPVTFDNALSSLKVLDRLGLTRRDRPFRTSRLYYRAYAGKVAEDLARRGVDVVHLYGITSFIPIIRRACPDIDIVLHSHDHALVDFDRETLLPRVLNCALLLGCSDFVCRLLKSRFPELAERCETLHNGVDARFLSTERRRSSRQNLLFVGRLSPEKGVHVLLDAFARVRRRFDSAHLRLVGPADEAPKQFVDPFDQDPRLEELTPFYQRRGSYLALLRRRADEIGGITFVGRLPNSELQAEHALADVFVFPSVWQEPFGIPVIEAMASGLPVIATRAGAFPEVVDEGVTGQLVERGDPAALANAIEGLLAEPQKAARMGAAGRERVRRAFTWDAQAARLLDLYARHCPNARRTVCASPS